MVSTNHLRKQSNVDKLTDERIDSLCESGRLEGSLTAESCWRRWNLDFGAETDH